MRKFRVIKTKTGRYLPQVRRRFLFLPRWLALEYASHGHRAAIDFPTADSARDAIDRYRGAQPDAEAIWEGWF